MLVHLRRPPEALKELVKGIGPERHDSDIPSVNLTLDNHCPSSSDVSGRGTHSEVITKAATLARRASMVHATGNDNLMTSP